MPFDDTMMAIGDILNGMLNRLQEGFCQSRAEEKLICRLRIVVINGVRDLRNLYEIDEGLVAIATHIIKDSLNNNINVTDQSVR